MSQSVTILTSTSASQTGTLILNPVAKSTTVTLTSTTAAGSSNATVQIEMTLGDPSLIPLGGPALAWTALSSGTAMSASAVVSGLVYTVLSPVGGVRVVSTTGSTTTTYSFNLQALQAVTA